MIAEEHCDKLLTLKKCHELVLVNQFVLDW